MHPFQRLSIAILLIFLIFCANAQEKGTLDFSTRTFEKGEIVTLDGEWEFYWKKLYSPDDFSSGKAGTPDLMVKTSSWNDLEVDGKKCGSYGYATYRIRLLNLPGKELMLDAYSVQTACKIFMNDSLVAEVGKTGKDAEGSQPANKDIQILIPAQLNDVVLIVQISNFHHRKGGFVHPFEIGEPDTILKQRLLYFILDSVESSALAIIGLFLFALYIFRRKDKSVLYFALFSLTLSFRPVISVNYLLSTLLPSLDWSWMIKMEYLGVLFPCLFMVLFIRELFPSQLPRVVVKIFVFLFSLKILITLLFPVAVFSWLVLPLLVVIPLGILILTYTILRAVLAKVDGANYAGLGVIVLFISLLLKVTSYSGIIPAVHVLITILDIGFIFMMSLILGSRFSMQFVKVETLQRETEIQKQEIESKKKELEHQKDLLQEKNKEILDSINYAKRLQTAILPPDKLIKSRFPESFILYKPKDIVAGDFYWIQEIEKDGCNHVLLAVGDCTGHGVPGAMVSVICNNALNRSVREFGLTDPGKILDKTREIVISEFEKSDEEVKDGMDISLVQFQISNNEISNIFWAGANNPLWYIENGEMKEIVADKQPIGKTEHAKPFTTHSLTMKHEMNLFLITDGFADQFGGALKGSVGGKKLKGSNLKKLLVEFHQLPIEEQKNRLEKSFYEWKGDLEQLDDVCIIGIKV